ncbi:MAG: rod-binding protein [Candidatus Muiribacteriaceae bacterium]
MNLNISGIQRMNNHRLDQLSKQTSGTEQKEELKKTCQEFESLFVNQLMKEMRKTVDKSGFIDGGHGEEIFQSMLDEEYAKEISKSQTLGLSDMLYSQLSINL